MELSRQEHQSELSFPSPDRGLQEAKALLAFGTEFICSRLPKAVQFTCYVIINSAHVYSPNSPSLVWMINSTVSLVFCFFLSSSLLRSHISIDSLSPRHRDVMRWVFSTPLQWQLLKPCCYKCQPHWVGSWWGCRHPYSP